MDKQPYEDYIGGLPHLHTVISNHRGHRESDLTLGQVLRDLQEAQLVGGIESPFQYLMFNEHTSDPARPRQLSSWGPQTTRLLAQRRLKVPDNHPDIYFGLEASILPTGEIDVPYRLASKAALIIASLHALPAPVDRDAAALSQLLRSAIQDPFVDVIGHPQRYIEDLALDWGRIFAVAAESGVAIEVNYNQYVQASTQTQRAHWRSWLTLLGASHAQIFIGLDIHSRQQLTSFIQDWQGKHGSYGLVRLAQAFLEAGITPDRVITAEPERFATWLSTNKRARGQ